MFGNVYLKYPINGECFWHDWCSYDDFVRRYTNYDTGRFVWVGRN